MSEESPQGWHSPSTWPPSSSLDPTSPGGSLSPQGFQALPDQQDFVGVSDSISPREKPNPNPRSFYAGYSRPPFRDEPSIVSSSIGQGARARTRSPPNQRDQDEPQVFILDCHGCLYADKHGNPVVVDSLVDTFTSCKFARPLVQNLFDFKDYSFFGPPYQYVIPKIVTAYKETAEYYLHTHGREQSGVSKDRLREIIYSSLCNARDRVGVIVPDSCEFRCHHQGKKISDMLLFGAGAPMDEQVLRLNPKTGAIKDVHTGFGLVKKDKGAAEFTSRTPIQRPFDIGIAKYERKIADLNSQILDLLTHSRTEDNINEIQKLREKLAKKTLKLQITRDSLQGGMQGPKYGYTDDYETRFGKELRLSCLLDFAIRNETIKPNDFVVVLACRTLPGNYTESPGKTMSESPARGGGSSRSKMKRKKIRKSIKRRKYTNCIDMIKNKKNRTRICKRKMQYRYVIRNPKTRKFTI
jgi:hypothetical protein